MVGKLRQLDTGFPLRMLVFYLKSGQVGFVVDEVTVRNFFSEHFIFPCQFSFHQMLDLHHQAGLV
jgi:hypothetical protein